MSIHRRLGKYAKVTRRQHKLNQEQVDALPWPHPRPARDERLIGLHLAFIWVALVQIAFGPPPNSVQGMGLGGYWGSFAFSFLMVVCCLMVIWAAYCPSQYESFGWEMAGTVGFSGTFFIYSIAATTSVNDWWGTNAAVLGVALWLSNTLRAVKLIRRLW